MPLSHKECLGFEAKAKSYKKFDGGGLYMEISPSGAKYWRMKYRYAGKEKRLSIGVFPEVGLADARSARDKARQQLRDDVDPSLEKQRAKQKLVIDADNTFAAVAQQWFEWKRAGWKVAHADKTWRRIEMHVIPSIGKIPIAQLDGREIIGCIQRIERSGAKDIAKRAYQNIKRVLDYAVTHNLVEYNIAHSIKPADVLIGHETQHNPHLEAHELPAFLHALENYQGEYQTKLGLKLMFLVFTRHTELLGATWDEFIFERSEWRIPGERMKKGRPHIVPLSWQAMKILHELKEINGVFDYVLPQKRQPRKHMSNGGLNNAIHRMGYKGRLTVHGIRGTASTILNEHGFNPDAIEVQQSRQDSNKVRASYNHAKYLDERRQMMQWWADFLDEQRRKANG